MTNSIKASLLAGPIESISSCLRDMRPRLEVDLINEDAKKDPWLLIEESEYERLRGLAQSLEVYAQQIKDRIEIKYNEKLKRERYDFSKIPSDLLEEAKDLVGDGENSEYLRGVCEVVSVYVPTAGDHSEKAIALAIHLGVSPEIAKRMY